MTLAKKILTGFITCFLILAGVAYFALKSSDKFVASSAWVEHTNQVLFQFEKIRSSSIEAESAERAFILTDNSIYLEALSADNAVAFDHLAKAKELTKDNPAQQQNLEDLAKKLKIHLDFFDRCIELSKSNPQKARELVASGEGKRIEDAILEIIDRAQTVENLLLTQRKTASLADAGTFNLIFAFLMLVIAGILIAVYRIISNSLKALKISEAETAEKKLAAHRQQ